MDDSEKTGWADGWIHFITKHSVRKDDFQSRLEMHELKTQTVQLLLQKGADEESFSVLLAYV